MIATLKDDEIIRRQPDDDIQRCPYYDALLCPFAVMPAAMSDATAATSLPADHDYYSCCHYGALRRHASYFYPMPCSRRLKVTNPPRYPRCLMSRTMMRTLVHRRC